MDILIIVFTYRIGIPEMFLKKKKSEEINFINVPTILIIFILSVWLSEILRSIYISIKFFFFF